MTDPKYAASLACLPERANDGDTLQIELKEPSTIRPLIITTSDGRVLARLEHNGESAVFINEPAWWQRLVARILRRPVSPRWVRR